MSFYRLSKLIASTRNAFVLKDDRQTAVVNFLDEIDVDSLLTSLCSNGLSAGTGLSLHFENLRGSDGIPAIDIFLNVENTPKEKNYIGSMGLYGLYESSTESGGQDGAGQNRIFDVGPVFTEVCHQSNWSKKKFELALIPNKPFVPGAILTIGRIALYYFE